jgi:hypothetical protein
MHLPFEQSLLVDGCGDDGEDQLSLSILEQYHIDERNLLLSNLVPCSFKFLKRRILRRQYDNTTTGFGAGVIEPKENYHGDRRTLATIGVPETPQDIGPVVYVLSCNPIGPDCQFARPS